MKYKKLMPVLLLGLFFISGCNTSEINIRPKREITTYSEKTLEAGQPVELNIVSDSANIEVYCWDKSLVKFEITKRIRGAEDKLELEEKLEDYKVFDSAKDGRVLLQTNCDVSDKNPQDRRIDLRITVPKKLQSMNYKLDIGSIKFFDDIKCDLNLEINMANVEINRFEGRLSLKGEMGSLRIGGGKIKTGSSISENLGNISIRGEFEDSGDYAIETKIGNIDLKVPSRSHISFENVGTVAKNEFPALASDTKVRLYSGMGKISIQKY